VEPIALPSVIASWLAPMLAALFVICVPIFLIANSVRWVTLDPHTYQNGFSKYQAPERTGLSQNDLEQVTRAFIDYFQGTSDKLNPVVTINGSTRPLFNEREVLHMEDVRHLMQLVFRLGLVAGFYLVAYAVGPLLWQHGTALPTLGRLCLWGSGLSIAILIIMAGLSLVDFTELFIRFHQMSFRNDLWMLDPRTDYLLILFPEGFWFDVTIKIAALTAAGAVAVGAVGLFLARR
jgi:integral membrane protein (TIGR01906 family)